MDWLDYRERLGIGFSDQEKVRYFYQKLSTMFQIIHVDLSIAEYIRFHDKIGRAPNFNLLINEEDGIQRFDHCMEVIFAKNRTFLDFLSYLVAFINCVDSNDMHNGAGKEYYLSMVEKQLSSSHILFEIMTDESGSYIFPKGIKEFDDALVSQPLAWLKDYPDAKKAWSKALREYANNSNGKASDIADLFRKALETFFHEFFGKDQTLQKLKPVYGGYLKSMGIPPEITQNYESILQSYITFMDAYAKHHDATSDKVLEYLMYQTGNIMRLLITLKQGEKKDAD